MEKGWIKLHRQIENWKFYFSEPFTKTQAWIDLVLIANHSHTPVPLIIRGNIIEIKRGQVGWSEEALAKRWKWSRGRVRRYLSLLEMVQQIVQQKSPILSVITIINYDDFQKSSTTDSTTDGQQTVQQTDTNKNDKNDKNVKNDKKEEEDSLRKESLKENFEKIFTAYKEKINNRAILTEQASLKIKTRLQEFSIEELLESIDKFSRDPWRMEHNSGKGMVWFFKNQEQVAKFLQLKTVEISKITGKPFSTNKKDYPIGTREHYMSPEEIRQFHLFPNQETL